MQCRRHQVATTNAQHAGGAATHRRAGNWPDVHALPPDTSSCWREGLPAGCCSTTATQAAHRQQPTANMKLPPSCTTKQSQYAAATSCSVWTVSLPAVCCCPQPPPGGAAAPCPPQSARRCRGAGPAETKQHISGAVIRTQLQPQERSAATAICSPMPRRCTCTAARTCRTVQCGELGQPWLHTAMRLLPAGASHPRAAPQSTPKAYTSYTFFPSFCLPRAVPLTLTATVSPVDRSFAL